MIYHIASASQWNAAQATGRYNAPSLQDEGFIHCSRLEQVLTVANNFYRDQGDLLLLCIDEGKLLSELKWEAPAHPQPVSGGSARSEDLFPHIYGPLNTGAVTAAHAFEETADGFNLPPGLPAP